MPPSKRQKGPNATKLSIFASNVSKLIGAMGSHSQLCEILATASSLANSLDKDRELRSKTSLSFGAKKEAILQDLDIDEAWKAIELDVPNCCFIEDIRNIERRCLDVMFGNPTMIGLMKHNEVEIPHLDSDNALVLDTTAVENPQFKELLSTCVSVFRQQTSSARMTYGNAGEKDYVTTYNRHAGEGMKIHSREQPLSRKMKTKTPLTGLIWQLSGKIDGMIEDQIVEIKHRNHKLMWPLPEYEVVQT